jgi:hypothetical protein
MKLSDLLNAAILYRAREHFVSPSAIRRLQVAIDTLVNESDASSAQAIMWDVYKDNFCDYDG